MASAAPAPAQLHCTSACTAFTFNALLLKCTEGTLPCLGNQCDDLSLERQDKLFWLLCFMEMFLQMLDTQYRMHPDICEFPSLQFYGGNIKTGEGVLAQTTKKWHKDKARHAALLCLHTVAGPHLQGWGSRQGCPMEQSCVTGKSVSQAAP